MHAFPDSYPSYARTTHPAPLTTFPVGRVAQAILFFLEIGDRRGGYHFEIYRRSTDRRRVPRPRFVRVGLWVASGVLDAGWIETVLRAGRSAFCDFQLLSAAGFVEVQACANSVCAGTGASTARAKILAGWICGDAQSCACADERTHSGNGVDGTAATEAACFAQDAEAEEGRKRRTTTIGIRCGRRRVAVVLAGAILRFQRIQPGESERETKLHARESGDPETSEASERLAVEQLVGVHER